VINIEKLEWGFVKERDGCEKRGVEMDELPEWVKRATELRAVRCLAPRGRLKERYETRGGVYYKGEDGTVYFLDFWGGGRWLIFVDKE
jgi:hypothetical protein